MKLQDVLNNQKEFQKRLGVDVDTLDFKENCDLIHTHTNFVIEECIEMLKEMPYHKSWKDYSTWDAKKMNEQLDLVEQEWTDIFIFLMNVAVLLGLDEKIIFDLYSEKLGLNNQRQEDPELGYVTR